MTESTAALALPPLTNTRKGKPRKLGVELEMKGLDIDTLSALVAAHLNGEVKPASRYEHEISGDSAGKWKVELDFDYLKQRGRQQNETDGLAGQLDGAAEDVLAAGAELLVPMEVVSPPLPMTRLGELQSLIAKLRDAGARGTRDGLTFAFGMHLNPELPDTDVDTVTRYLKAYLCLYDWLKARAEVDLMRRVTVYIDPFPTDYVRKVIDPDYWPDMPQLIDDYLADNPTRNRALDMLPLFAFIDEDRVKAAVDDPRIKARPTLHYRLPNCEIDEPGWDIASAWADWLQVEHLAMDKSRLNELCGHYLAHLQTPIGRLVNDWTEQLEPWLKDPADL